MANREALFRGIRAQARARIALVMAAKDPVMEGSSQENQETKGEKAAVPSVLRMGKQLQSLLRGSSCAVGCSLFLVLCCALCAANCLGLVVARVNFPYVHSRIDAS